ncbi:hypothetical protein D3C72_1218640 [compost metagenome]
MASSKAAAICSGVVKFRLTPLPWLPSKGLMATAPPRRRAARRAASGDRTISPFGTGRPASARSALVRSLSEARSTAMSLVWLVMVARMRRWCLPQPS